jgi:hypothetical protein
MGWKSCIACCAGTGDTRTSGEQVPAETGEEVDEEQFVFFEHFPTDKRVENPVSSSLTSELWSGF